MSISIESKELGTGDEGKGVTYIERGTGRREHGVIKSDCLKFGAAGGFYFSLFFPINVEKLITLQKLGSSTCIGLGRTNCFPG
jgi:hypothetical protein